MAFLTTNQKSMVHWILQYKITWLHLLIFTFFYKNTVHAMVIHSLTSHMFFHSNENVLFGFRGRLILMSLAELFLFS